MKQTVTYNFPENSTGPFSIESDGNLFITANGLSNLAKDISDFSIEKLSQNIPMGYKTIVICQRWQVWEHGKLLKNWGNDNQRSDAKFYALSNTSYEFHRLDGDSKIKTATLYKPNSADASLASATWNSITQCSASAKAHSETYHCAVIVSAIIDTISWH